MIELESELKSLRRLIEQLVLCVDEQELETLRKLRRVTPDARQLRLIAAEYPPPAEWFEGDVEKPW